MNDPWFAASSPKTSSTGATYYTTSPSSPVSVLGCTQQAQFCNPSTSNCSPLTGLLVDFDADALNMTSQQRAVFDRLNTTITYGSGISAIATVLGPSVLLADRFDVNGYSLPYPDDQWVQELSNWFQIILTNMQLQVSRFVGGPSNPTAQRYIVPPTEEDSWMCDAQIVQRQNYPSFSVLGLALLLVLGGIFILTSAILDLTTDILQDRQEGRQRLKHLEWSLSGTLQLQRMAFEGRGHDKWDESTFTKLVPITKSGESFELLSTTLDESEMARSRKGSQNSWWTLSPTQTFKTLGSKLSGRSPTVRSIDDNESQGTTPRPLTPASTLDVAIPDATIPLDELSSRESLQLLSRPLHPSQEDSRSSV